MGVVNLRGLDTNMDYFDADKNRKMIEKYQGTGEKKYKDQLVLGNLGLVFNILNNFPRHKHERLFSYAVEGLILSIENFDLGKGVYFSTYAHSKVWGKINIALKRKINEKLTRRAENAYYGYKQITKKSPNKTLEEVAEQLDVSRSELEKIILFVERGSLNFELDSEDSNPTEIIDLLNSEENVNVDYVYLGQIISNLNEEYQKIIRMRIEGYSQNDIGEELGFSQVSAGRKVNSFRKEFKRHIRENDEFQFGNLVGHQERR